MMGRQPQMFFLLEQRDFKSPVLHLSCGQGNLEDGGVRFWHGQVPEQYMAILLLVLHVSPRWGEVLYFWFSRTLLVYVE